ASRVRASGRPGSDGMYTHVSAGRSAATSFARCRSRGEISSEPAATSSEMRASRRGSVALAGNDIGLVLEPEAAVLAQHVARRVEVAGVTQHFAQAHVIDLRHIDGRVPRGKQGR